MTRPRFLMLTCDCEALPSGAPDHHVDRLVWGRFPDAPYEVGIGKLMDIADEFGMEIVFFHDVLEREHYGPETDRVARYILERGHDLQLHLHVEFLPPSFWRRRGWRPPTWGMNLYNDDTAWHLIDYSVELFEAMAGVKPLAFRAGAFRYNASVLRALAARGIPLSFQYHPGTAHKNAYPHGFDAGVLPLFRWSNGLLEVPVGVHENRPPRGTLPRYKTFELHELVGGIPQAEVMLHRHWSLGPGYEVFVVLLHSWSLLYRDDHGHYVWRDARRVDLFRELLARLAAHGRVISTRDLLAELSHQRLVPAFEMPIQVAGTEAIPPTPLAEGRHDAAPEPHAVRDVPSPRPPAPSP